MSSTPSAELEGVGPRPEPTAPAPRVHQPSAHPHAASVHAGGGRPGQRSETRERSTARRGPNEPKELELQRAGGARRPGPRGAGLRPAFPRWGAGPASCGNHLPKRETVSAPGKKAAPKIL